METSAKTGDNVEEVFILCCKLVYLEQKDKTDKEETMSLPSTITDFSDGSPNK